MKFYKRQLNSLADLKREKVMLQYVKGEHDAADLFSTKGLKKGKKHKGLSEDSSPLSSILSMGMGLMGLGGGKKSKKSQMPFAEITGNPAISLLLKALPRKKIAGFAMELFSGYLKWRAIEGGIWGIKKLLEMRKEKKRLQHETDFMDPARKRQGIGVAPKKKFFGLF